jgi:hypothetical protein
MKVFFPIVFFLLLPFCVNAQVMISGGNNEPDNSAMLEVQSESRGFLPPRMTTAQRDLIQNPAEGLQVYNTDTKCLDVFVGTGWKHVCPECDFPGPVVASNSPVCSGTSLMLSASEIAGASYSWTGPDGFSASVREPVINGVSAIHAGTYTVTATIGECTSSAASLEVVVVTTPAAPGAGSNSPVCPGTDLQLTAGAVDGASYQWSGPGGFTSGDQNPVVANPQSGEYSVYAYIEGCQSPGSQISVSVQSPDAAGGTISDISVNGTPYRVHRFNTGGTFTPNQCISQVEYLIVAGGGGGGTHFAGAGGAGGMLTGTTSVSAQSYTVTVGSGGAGALYVSPTGNNVGQNGGNSSFGSFGTAVGGGGGGGRSSAFGPGQNGGSGGGGGNDNAQNVTPGAGVSGQGFSGGVGFNSGPDSAGGGGGGAGGAGGSASFQAGGAKGGGLANSITGTAVTYSQGGSGATWTTPGQAGGTTSLNANANTGCGGGGGNASTTGGNGGSGVVIIRYPLQ